jgi:hypothetical protein
VLLHKSNRLVLQVFEEDGTLSLRSATKYLIHLIQLCQWLQQQHEANQNFIEIILFKDECLFLRQGTFNNHNYHVWTE